MSCCVVQTSYTSGQTLASSHEAELFRSNYTIETQIGSLLFSNVVCNNWFLVVRMEISTIMCITVKSRFLKILLLRFFGSFSKHYLLYIPSQLSIWISRLYCLLKPENILLRRPLPHCDIALCDFGLAKYLRTNEVIRDLVGTPDYAAPEVLNYDPIHLTTDIWSVGVVVYYLLTSESPFWDESKEHTYLNVCQLKISYPDHLFHNISVEAMAFIKRLIQRNPKDRPSAIDCLDDPWFSSTNFTDALNTDNCNQNELITVSNDFTMSNNQNFVE
ncbi:Serine/threonine-protein kinase 17A [Schistosoma japonicum]|nr:Serine/threonine-protein kinase 17A [Schistosoma japonicum]